ncbi:unnamed protein product, partial [Rotaria sp. Silwood2]
MPCRKKHWCSHPSHVNSTRLGSKPTHPKGLRIIDVMQAEIFNKQVESNSEWMSVIFKAGDKVCQRYYNFLPDISNDSFDLEEMDIEFADQMATDYVRSNSENIDLPSFEEKLHTKQSAKEELNAVFELLKMEKIRD